MWDFCAFLEGYHLLNTNMIPLWKCFWRHLTMLLSMAVLSSRHHLSQVLVGAQCLQPAYQFNTLEVHENHPTHFCNTTYSYQDSQNHKHCKQSHSDKISKCRMREDNPKKAAQTPSHFLILKTETCMIYPAAKTAVLISTGRHKCPFHTLEMEHLGVCSIVFTVTQAGDGISCGL